MCFDICWLSYYLILFVSYIPSLFRNQRTNPFWLIFFSSSSFYFVWPCFCFRFLSSVTQRCLWASLVSVHFPCPFIMVSACCKVVRNVVCARCLGCRGCHHDKSKCCLGPLLWLSLKWSKRRLRVLTFPFQVKAVPAKSHYDAQDITSGEQRASGCTIDRQILEKLKLMRASKLMWLTGEKSVIAVTTTVPSMCEER